MKRRIKKTGEIVDVISFSCFTERCSYDKVSYIDSKGNEILDANLNLYWDFEEVCSKQQTLENINWEKRRYEIAKEMMPILSERTYRKEGVQLRYARTNVAKEAVFYADALIEELKNKIKSEITEKMLS